MADKPKYGRSLFDDPRVTIYAPNSLDALNKMDEYNRTTKGEFWRPPNARDTFHLTDDEGAQALQDAMRLRMQLPRGE